MASFFFSFVLVRVELSLSCLNHPPSTSHHTCARKPQHLPPVSKNRFALPSLRDLKTFQAHFAHKETPHYTRHYTRHRDNLKCPVLITFHFSRTSTIDANGPREARSCFESA